MTINKSLISIVAATLLVTGFAGCGSSGGGSSSASTPASTPASTSGVVSSVQAVDGYIYNAKVQAFYLKDDNTTMGSVTLKEANLTTKNSSTGLWTVGSNTYTLPEANASIQSRIRFFKITSNPYHSKGLIYTPATYIEADGVPGYDTNDTLLNNTVIYAPANSGIASPITSLVVTANPGLFGINGSIKKGVDLNATTFKEIDSNLTAIAKNLGLGDIDLKTADPVELAKTNPKFRLATALLKGVDAAGAKKIINAKTPAKDLSTMLSMIAGATTGNAKSAAQGLENLAKNGALTDDAILNMNLEKTVSTGNLTSKTSPNLKGKFPVSGITIDGVDTSTLNTSKGAKYNISNKLDINMTLASKDENVSNTPFKLLVAFKNAKTSMADDVNTSSSVIAEIPFDLNITSGKVGVTVDPSAMVNFQIKSKDGANVISKDMNVSALKLDKNVISSSSSNMLNINLNDIVNSLQKASDINTTKDLNDINGTISNVQVMLNDPQNAIVGAKDKNTYLPLARGTFSDIGTDNIVGVNAYKLLDNSVLDMRGGATGANAAPDNNFTIGNADKNASLPAVETNASDTNEMPILLNNHSYDMNITKQTVNTNEVNTTVAFTFGSNLKDVNSSAVSKLVDSKKYANVKNAFDVNTTDTTEGNLTSTIKMTATDEFGDSNTTTMNVLIARAPIYVGTISNDRNFTIVKNPDGWNNLSIPKVYITENNGSGLDLNSSYQPINVSDSGSLVKAKLVDSNKTIEFNTTIGADWNITAEINATNGYFHLNKTVSIPKK